MGVTTIGRTSISLSSESLHQANSSGLTRLELAFDAEPQTYATHDSVQLLGCQISQRPHEAHSGHRDNTLRIKCTAFEKASWYGHFESRASKACGVRDYCDERAILVSIRYTEN